MDIIFVNSINFTESNPKPLGLLSLATILNNNGYDAKIIDVDYMFTNKELNFSKHIDVILNNICDIIIAQNPKIVSFYTMCNSYPLTIQLAKCLKQRKKEITIIFGGPQASLTAIETLKFFPFIDIIGLGEGETTILNIVKGIIDKVDKKLIKGIAYKKNNYSEEIILNNNTNLIQNLDELPLINFDLLNNNEISESINIDVGRGCPFSCTFCSTSLFWKKKYRLKSNTRLIHEIKILKEKYNINKFVFDHDMFTFNKNQILDFCQRVISENLIFEWSCSARIDCLDEDLLYYMSKSGCKNIFLGIESGSKKIQKLINKNLNVNLIYEKVKSIKKFNINPTLSFIYGFFEETIDDLNCTLNLIFKFIINDISDIQMHKLMIMPGTSMYKQLENNLYLDYKNVNGNMFEHRYLNNLIFLIESNKKIFCNFYEFDTEIRKKFNNLDTFIYFLVFIHYYYRFTLKDILINYKDNYTSFYLNYKNFIDDLVNQVFVNQYNDIDLQNEIMPNLFFNCFKNIFKTYSLNTSKNERINKLYEFESEIKNFRENSNEPEKILTYNFDIFDLINNRNYYKSNEEIYKIKLIRLNENGVKIKKYI